MFPRLRGVSAVVGGTAVLLGCDQIRRSRVFAKETIDHHNALATEQKLHLKGLVVFFRHGARTPLRHLVGVEEVHYDKNFFDGAVPHAEIPVCVKSLDGGERPACPFQQRYQQQPFEGGMEAGKLTKLGKEQAYVLGRRLRQKYGEDMHFLPAEFIPEDIYLRSTNIQRCVESLQAALAGLFGQKAFTKAGDTATVGRFDMTQHRDHMVARKTHGLPVPQWMLDMEDDIEKSAVRHILQHVKGPVGILNLIQNNLTTITTEHPSAKKLYLYSCHDTTLIPVLVSLGCFDNKWPNYAADIVFEVYEDNEKKNWIKVVYEGKEQILSGFKSALIPKDKFMKLVKPFSLTDQDYLHKCSDLKAAKKHSAFWEAAMRSSDQVVDAPPGV
ncbi:hypothetical protein CAPTEDRAFT_196462 [Capitella teleta]|uniref:Lysophosphatidic acid phosphatase type 6 n=1 Tax=Capitella teleta TaxID=283909 RepID=R7V7V3_CAPTE|nr:hypothetical protein CAPTEDRAFT_196462 [Capitella teleta]|eukprot:ELU12451.1 hypothetical protein CAPTEDRAFT_196462 [Capitella teleta]